MSQKKVEQYKKEKAKKRKQNKGCCTKRKPLCTAAFFFCFFRIRHVKHNKYNLHNFTIDIFAIFS